LTYPTGGGGAKKGGEPTRGRQRGDRSGAFFSCGENQAGEDVTYFDSLSVAIRTVDTDRRGREWLATAAGLRAGYYLLLTAFLLSWVVLSSSYRPDTRLLPIAVR